MRIAIVGIGGVGGYFGGLLSRQYSEKEGFEIIFVARGKHLEAIKQNGLQVQSKLGHFITKPSFATNNPAELGKFDVILFCVKEYDLRQSARLLQSNVGEDTIVIPLLNGVGNDETLRGLLKGGIIFNGGVYIGAHLLKPGVCAQTGGSCQFYFGFESGLPAKGPELEKMFTSAGIQAAYRTDIRKIVWEKYIFISPFASATTYFDKSMRALLDSDTDRAFLENLIREILSIAAFNGIKFKKNAMKNTIEKASLFPYETKTSMQMDFEKGKKAELDIFTGFVVNQAREFGVAVPYHQKVLSVLRQRL